MTALLPFDDRDGVIWLDGSFVPWREAKLHALSHGLHYAGAVFEGERAYGGRIFQLRAHSERLIASARLLEMEFPYSAMELDAAAMGVVAVNGLTDAYVRPVAWRSAGDMGLSARKGSIHVAIAAWAWPSYFAADKKLKGLRLTRAAWARPAPHTAPTRAKAASLYAIGTLAKNDAERRGFDDALMLDWEGKVAEATAANIVFVMDGVLHTPTPVGFLDGITRRIVMELAAGLGYSVVERAIWPHEMAQAQECFLTGTAAEVAPVESIDEVRFEIGPVTRQILAAYAERVREG